MIPEENSSAVEQSIRATIQQAIEHFNALHPNQEPIKVEIKRMLLAESMKPQAAQAPLIEGLQKHAHAIFGETIPAVGTPLYTDVRLYAEQGVPGVIYGAGPRTVLESRAKRADERLLLSDLLKATQVVARTLYDLMSNPKLRN
jgi:acetylornithine deacetylase/succinyl-diaminopimelate desuccinylase-like protein